MIGMIQINPRSDFPGGDFLCSIVLDIVRRLKRLLWMTGGLPKRNRLQVMGNAFLPTVCIVASLSFTHKTTADPRMNEGCFRSSVDLAH